MDDTLLDSRLAELRERLRHGVGISQREIDEVVSELAPLRSRIRPADKLEELPLFSDRGEPLGTCAPRWVCHVLALRHRCAHVLLLWESPVLETVLVLQIRAWTKDDSPGRVDISVGGHMTTARGPAGDSTALKEMLEETGLTEHDLNGAVEHMGGYAFDESRPGERFHNSEWRDVYIGRVKADSLAIIHFPDGEVAGIVLVPVKDGEKLLEQRTIPLANALTESLPRCLSWRVE